MNKIYTAEIIEKAKNFAHELHKNDKCIVTSTDKIFHLDEVVHEIQKLNLNQNIVVILAYLHDSLDYANGEEKEKILSTIQKLFGNYIAQLVLEVSDNFRIENLSTPKGIVAFKTRRIQIVSPTGISDYAAKVILAEKVCNLRAMLELIQKSGNTYWEKFSLDYNLKKDNVKEYYELIYDVLSTRCYGDRRLRNLIDEYDYLVYKIFG